MIDGIINNGPKQPTVAELEAQAKAGEQISLLDLANAVQRERGDKKKVRGGTVKTAAAPAGSEKDSAEKRARKGSYDMENVTFEEMSLMCIYNSTGTREGLIDALTEMRGYLGPDETELLALTDSSIEKLTAMSDDDYAAPRPVPGL